MWVNRKVWLVATKLTEENAALRARVEQLQVIIAGLNTDVRTKDQTIDWFTTYVNDLRVERQALLERLLGVQMPLAQFERPNDGPIAPFAGHEPAPLAPASPADQAAARAFAIYQRDAKVEKIQPADPLREFAEKGAAIFEDMGDEAARKEGIVWTPEGEVANG